MAQAEGDRLGSLSISTAKDSEETLIRSAKGYFNIPPSPYPMYIAVCFFFFPFAVNGLAYSAVIFNKVCYAQYHNLTLCQDDDFISSHPELQGEASIWGMYDSLVQMPFAIFASLMISSYCDKVGHKLPFFLPILGISLASFYLALLATPRYIEWSMGTIFVYSVFSSIFGNFTMVVMTSLSYIALITPKAKKSTAITACEGATAFGMVIGDIFYGLVLGKTNLTTLVYINACITIIPLFIVAIFVTDAISVTVADRNHTWKDTIGFSHLMDSIRVAFKKRRGQSRYIIHLSLVVFAVYDICNSGYMSNNLFYFVYENQMSTAYFTIYLGSVLCSRSIVGQLVLMIAYKFGNPRSTDIMMCVSASVAVAYILMAYNSLVCAWTGAVFLSALNAIAGETKALQTRMCEEGEIGRLFSYSSFVQIVATTIASVGYKFLYSVTVTVWPGMFFAVSAFLTLISMFVIIKIDKLLTADKVNKSISSSSDSSYGTFK